ncbi:protein SSUH2 homolog [Homarus americanus]|uniref:protein SSUH2 homolog n=1 Tax=Homarus americanus TaxID=6706 RepID=UPI001C47153F|nr:protein SSUH2 homolog [Homarus americanus]XP_042206974.1 protein SSUH2 homolog [Homarus americanus]XP_042206981.1 protein SSUH2 homolog [Homarus americanus]
MNGRVLHQEEVVRVHVATTTTTTAACSTSNNGPPPPRRVLLLDQRGGRIAGPLRAEAGGEFTFELIENYPSLGLSAVQDGSGTIINWRGTRGNNRLQRSNRKERDILDHSSESNKSPRSRPSVLDPYLPTFQHLLCDLDLVASSLHLKNYPVCENDLYDVNISVPPPNGGVEEDRDRTETRGPLPPGPQITDHQARAALLAHVADRCCWGSGAAKKMSIAKISYDSAFHYELQTFTEKRETSWAFTPYGGGDVDGPSNGAAPLPWDVEAHPAHLFHDEVKVVQVPHTASVKECHRCKGTGSLQCSECHGKGWTRCLSCHGDGWYTDSSGYKERCFYCQSSTHGHGRQDCLKCNAKGRVACPPCDSYGQIRCFIRLTITWKVNTSEHIVRKGGLPEALVKEVSGQVAFEEEGTRIFPLTQFPDNTINLASAQLVNNHKNAFHDERTYAQRHQVRIVPVAEVEYGFKGGPGKFWVYGYENKVHSPDYPHTCCWGCCCVM